MRREINTVAALVLAGTFAWAGTAFALEGKPQAHRHGPRYRPAYEALALAPEPFWSTGYYHGLTYNPYYCYAPGTCVFGYNPY